MTLGELKKQTTFLIEEYSEQGENYTSDADIRRKIVQGINVVCGELAKIKAIFKSKVYRSCVHFVIPEGGNFVGITLKGFPYTDYEFEGRTYTIYGKDDVVFSYEKDGVVYNVPLRMGESHITLPLDCQTLTGVYVDGKPISMYSLYGRQLTVLSKEDFEIRYDAFAPHFTASTSNDTELPFEDAVCDIMPFGVGKYVLMVTGQINDANELEQKYYQLIQELTPTAGKIKPKFVNLWHTSI